MNKHQKNNLLCILGIIFGGLIIAGGYKDLGPASKTTDMIMGLLLVCGIVTIFIILFQKNEDEPKDKEL